MIPESEYQVTPKSFTIHMLCISDSDMNPFSGSSTNYGIQKPPYSAGSWAREMEVEFVFKSVDNDTEMLGVANSSEVNLI